MSEDLTCLVSVNDPLSILFKNEVRHLLKL